MYAEELVAVKIAEMILVSRLVTHLRYPSPYSISSNMEGEERWLGLEMEEDAALRAEIESRIANSFTLDIFLQLPDNSNTGVEIQLESQVDGNLKPFKRQKILLETWRLKSTSPSKTRMCYFIRGLHCLLRLLPCYRLCRSLRKAGNTVLITFQFRNVDGVADPEAVGLEESILDEGITEVSSTYDMPDIEGVKLSVQYRTNCRFQIKSQLPVISVQSPKERAYSFETVHSLQPEQPLGTALKKAPSANELSATPPSIITTQRRTSYPPPPLGSSLKRQSAMGKSQSSEKPQSRNRSVDLTSVVRSLEMLRYAEHPVLATKNQLPAQGYEELIQRYNRLKERIQQRNSVSLIRSTSPIQEDDVPMEKDVEELEDIFPFAQ